MPQTVVTYSGSAVASSGASVSFSRSMAVEGVNVSSVPIASGSSVDVTLGATSPELQLLVIKPSAPSASITFEIEGDGNPLALDQPLILGGAGAIKLLGTVTFLRIANAGAAAVTVDILVGRDPNTPTP